MTPLFGIFGVAGIELLVVGGVVLLLFGNRLPGLMRSMGRSVVEFKKGVSDLAEEPKEIDDEKGRSAAG